MLISFVRRHLKTSIYKMIRSLWWISVLITNFIVVQTNKILWRFVPMFRPLWLGVVLRMVPFQAKFLHSAVGNCQVPINPFSFFSSFLVFFPLYLFPSVFPFSFVFLPSFFTLYPLFPLTSLFLIYFLKFLIIVFSPLSSLFPPSISPISHLRSPLFFPLSALCFNSYFPLARMLSFLQSLFPLFQSAQYKKPW